MKLSRLSDGLSMKLMLLSNDVLYNMIFNNFE